MIEPLTYFWLLLKASLFSTGGLGNLPILHEDLLARGWATERHFAEALAVGQVSPGPSGLWVISLGFLTAGWLGAVLALVAISLPPLLVLAVERVYNRTGDHPAVRGFIRGLSLAVIGIFLVVLAGLMIENGLDIGTALIVLGSLALGITGRVPVVALLALGALAGIAFY
ncbi:MAG: chromate transporter [Chloroflexota bacterium]|nr:chromate transporter [Chloroflexota bacterium]